MKNEFCKKIALLIAMTLSLGISGCGKKAEPLPENGENKAQTEEVADTAAASEEPQLQTAFVQADNAPTVSAGTAILVEQSTGTILFDKNAKDKMYPASMTKMVTALVVMDHFNADELITVGSEINEVSLDSSKAGHVIGETLTVKNLIRGLIIPSGNDSANVLAAAVAKKTQNNQNLSFAESQEVFAKLMNEKAKELGAVNTHFTNAHGYHDENHYSCAYDMALFARAYLDNSTLTEIANEKSFTGNGADNMLAQNEGMKTQDYSWVSHNLLITNNEYSYGYASGIKTGFTNEAGDCVSAAATKDGETLIAIIFNSPDPARWVDAKSLFEFGFNEYEKVELGKAAVAAEEMPLIKHNRLEGDTLDVVFNRDIITYLPKGTADKVSKTIAYEQDYLTESKDGTAKLKAPIAKDAKVGTASFQIDGKTVLTESVYAGREVSKASLWSGIKYFFKNFADIVFTVKSLIALVIIAVAGGLLFIGFRIFSGRRRRPSRGYSLRQPTFRKSKKRGGRRF
ncbi:MAG: D-alanyl-D-alanine carboxypeptidase [Clostridia bacterium]|nr:D-alanyl-D-alanine carboxypeptidase [Clostridia bacterium]